MITPSSPRLVTAITWRENAGILWAMFAGNVHPVLYLSVECVSSVILLQITYLLTCACGDIHPGWFEPALLTKYTTSRSMDQREVTRSFHPVLAPSCVAENSRFRSALLHIISSITQRYHKPPVLKLFSVY